MVNAQRAALYARVSTDEQGKGYSLITQLEACRKYCDERGYVTAAEFVDEYSCTELSRPGLDKARELAEGRGFERLVVLECGKVDYHRMEHGWLSGFGEEVPCPDASREANTNELLFGDSLNTVAVVARVPDLVHVNSC